MLPNIDDSFYSICEFLLFSIMHIAHFLHLICSQTPLHYATRYNHYSIAVALLKYRANAQQADIYGMSV